MQLFSEIYGAYFRTVSKLLALPECTEQELGQIIRNFAFRESILFLPQKLRPETTESWGLLRRTANGSLAPVTKHSPPGFVTVLQKRWLRAKLMDPRMRLFLSDAALEALENELQDITPLFLPGMLHYFDQFSDGDPYGSAQYRQNFQRILQAMRENEVLRITFVSGKNKQICARFLPLKLEYSQKNDKFRLFCSHRNRHGSTSAGLINVGRIVRVEGTGKFGDPQKHLQDCLEERRCRTPVQLLVTNERNGIERFMTEFAPYEKQTRYDPETGQCSVTLWYDQQDETEVLIRLLGFGPVLEILGPPAFRRQAAERVRRQYALLRKMNSINLS